MVRLTYSGWGCRWIAALAIAALGLSGARMAAAASSVGKVAGSVRPPAPATLPENPVLNRGFVPRIRNPIIPPRPYDPLRWVIVVLEPQNDLEAEFKAAPKTAERYEIIGESFRTPIFPVAVRGTLEIRNAGPGSHRLRSPTIPDLLPADPINPKGVRSATVEVAHKPIILRDQDSPHVRGVVVAFPLRYFALVDRNGEFVIPDVPTGRWKVRIWYRDGWLKIPPVTIDVSANRTSTVKSINLPARMQIDAPEAAGSN